MFKGVMGKPGKRVRTREKLELRVRKMEKPDKGVGG